MESTGIRGMIQLSQTTADLLIASGKGSWVIPREEVVTAKGKGTLQTYWLKTSASAKESATQLVDASHPHVLKTGSIEHSYRASDKHIRLVGWMSEVLIDYVKQIVSYSMGWEILVACG
jgi:hypothetical protein